MGAIRTFLLKNALYSLQVCSSIFVLVICQPLLDFLLGLDLPAWWSQVYTLSRVLQGSDFNGGCGRQPESKQLCRMSGNLEILRFWMGYAVNGPAVISFFLVWRKVEIQNRTTNDTAFLGLEHFSSYFLFVPTLRGKLPIPLSRSTSVWEGDEK